MGVFSLIMSEQLTKQRSLPIQKNGCFWNHQDEKPRRFLWDSVKMFFHSLKRRHAAPSIIAADWTHYEKPVLNSEKPIITWIGHSTFLIQIGGINIITDPIFGNASLFFPRIFPPGIKLQHLPPIHCVLISHNHRDHMDAASIRALHTFNPFFMVPAGNKSWFKSKSINSVHEFLWWEQYKINQILTITFLPSHHWSQRTIFDRNKTLWGSWLIEYYGFKIYFAGDTAYSDHFKEIGNEYDSIDVALMPIGPCKPESHMKHSHIDAQQAIQGFKELGGIHFIPMHWGTFYFGIDQFLEPIHILNEQWAIEKFDDPRKLQLLKIGQSIQF